MATPMDPGRGAAGQPAVPYSYRLAAAGALVGLVVSLGMIPAGGGLAARAGMGLRFAAIGALFTAWIVFWLNRCDTGRQQRMVRIVLAGLAPFLLFGVLLGGLIGVAGIFVNLFLPVFVVLPPLVYGLRREWRSFAAALAAVLVLAPLLVRGVLRETPEEVERRRRFCAEWYDAGEAVWNAEARTCDRSAAGEMRDGLEGATVHAPGPAGATPVMLYPEFDERRQERFARGAVPPEAGDDDADVVVTIRRADRITVLEGERDPRLFLVPFHVDRPRTGAGAAAYVGVFRDAGGWNVEHVGSLRLAAGAEIADVSATLTDTATRTWEGRIRYADGRPDEAFTFRPDDPTPPAGP